MASFSCSGDIDWLWGSLKPWQILHSTLAERERNGSVDRDVWELVNETLGANKAKYSTTREEPEVQEQEAEKGWPHGMRFLSDDGEYWRHGGVMESRIREWLTRRDEENDFTNHALIMPISSANDHLHLNRPHNQPGATARYRCMNSSADQLAIACRSAPVHQQYHDTYSSAVSEAQLQLVAADRISAYNSDDSTTFDSDAEEEQIAGIGADEDVDDEENDLQSAAAEEVGNVAMISADYEDNYALISSSYGEDRVYNGVSCSAVVNRCCREFAAAAAVDIDDDDGELVVGATKLAGMMAAGIDVEEEIEVCAVCLEKLNNDVDEEVGGGVVVCRRWSVAICSTGPASRLGCSVSRTLAVPAAAPQSLPPFWWDPQM